MPLIEGRCKNCGGEIKFDSNREKGFCSFCGTPFLKEDLIINQHYHNNFSGANVILNDLEGVEKQLENAENNLTRFKNYDRAETIYRNITEKASGEYRAWWGLVRVLSHEFTVVSLLRYEEMELYANNAFRVADNVELKNKLREKWNQYKTFVVNNEVKLKNDLKNHLLEMEAKQNDKNQEMQQNEKMIVRYENTATKLEIYMFLSVFFSLVLLCIGISLPINFIIVLSVVLVLFICVYSIFNNKSKVVTEKIIVLTKEVKNANLEILKIQEEMKAVTDLLNSKHRSMDEYLKIKQNSQSNIRA